MSISQPGAASTQAESAPTTQAVSQPSYIGSACLIWVENLIQLQSSALVLHRKWMRLKDSPVRNAIWDGCWALKEDVNRCAEASKQRGLLLLCWEGTTARRAHRS